MIPMISHFILLALFLIGAKIVSMIVKRPVNGAFGYLVVGGVFIIIGILPIFNTDTVPLDQRYFVLGQVLGALIVPYAVGFFLHQWFKKKNSGNEEVEHNVVDENLQG